MTWPDTGANALYVAYLYDALNHVTQIQENGATSGAGLLASYTYDSLGRRSGIARAGGSGASTSYAYDAASRLNTLVQTLAGSASVTYTLGYNTANQILTRQLSNSAYVARPGGIASAYTTNGLNQYSGVTGSTATYTAANAPVLTYDPTGALQTDTNAGATTNFLYDGANVVGEYDNSGNILSRYVTGPRIDEPVVWYQGSGTTTRNWLTADNQGSVIGYADQSGNSGATYAYGPYGEPITSGGASAWGGSRYRYTGQIEIPEAQIYYYKARVYDPSLGRFNQTDPVGYSSDVNSYAYAGNDPINAGDPSGLLIYGNSVNGISVVCDTQGPATMALGDTDDYWFDSKGNINTFWGNCSPTFSGGGSGGGAGASFSFGPAFGGSGGAGSGGGAGTELQGVDVTGHRKRTTPSVQGISLPSINFGSLLKVALCHVGPIGGNIGADAYAGVGGSVGAGITFNPANGQIEIPFSAAVGVGFGLDGKFGPSISRSNPTGADGVVSAGLNYSVGGTAGIAGFSYSQQLIGTSPGSYTISGGPGAGVSGYANVGAAASFNLPKIYDLHC